MPVENVKAVKWLEGKEVMFFHKKVFTPFIAMLTSLLFATVVFLVTFLCMMPRNSGSVPDLYGNAVADSVNADADEIFSLVTLTKESEMVTWNEDEKRVLLLSWNDSPEVYTQGAEIVFDGEIWTFTDREILA